MRWQPVHDVLQQRGWQLLDGQPIRGGFAAELYRLRVVDEQGVVREAVYKRLLPERNTELALYRDVLPEVPHAIATLYGVVDVEGEQGLILEAAGVAVKEVFAQQNCEEQRKTLRELIRLLADLHVALADKSQQWLVEGRTSAYPFQSSQEWAQTAIEQLAWLKDHAAERQRLSTDTSTRLEERQGRVSLPIELDWVREAQEMADVFYPRYPEWTVGRQTYTHGDPHLENVLVQGDQYRLIDWEWACVSLPQRDLSILLQDVYMEELHDEALPLFQHELEIRGWEVGDPSAFRRAYLACLFDNTLMMLGWEIGKYRDGYLGDAVLARILAVKWGWLQSSFRELMTQKNDS